MKVRNSSEPEELVVIGVNSVFLTTENANNFKICEDVCKAYKWLDSLEKLRKITAFGYIYCCKVTEKLKEQLDGFPVEIQRAKDTTDQMETNEIKKSGTDSDDVSTDVVINEDVGKSTTIPDDIYNDDDQGEDDYDD